MDKFLLGTLSDAIERFELEVQIASFALGLDSSLGCHAQLMKQADNLTRQPTQPNWNIRCTNEDLKRQTPISELYTHILRNGMG